MNDPPLAVILDFDGTITLRDIGDLIIKGFGREGWRAADEAYSRGEISLRELWAVEVDHLRAEDHDAIRRKAIEIAKIRPFAGQSGRLDRICPRMPCQSSRSRADSLLK